MIVAHLGGQSMETLAMSLMIEFSTRVVRDA